MTEHYVIKRLTKEEEVPPVAEVVEVPIKVPTPSELNQVLVTLSVLMEAIFAAVYEDDELDTDSAQYQLGTLELDMLREASSLIHRIMLVVQFPNQHKDHYLTAKAKE